MFKRIKNLWKLSDANPSVIERTFETIKENQKSMNNQPIVDFETNAEFLGEGSHDEFIEQERADKGLDKWYKRIGL